ncbi:MAG TPA: hypothetical protein VM077_00135 [Candidatus Limnocylindrales bacterium]|nr:hypothetical protein [Candidatus Limnocylindrales bacterium]
MLYFSLFFLELLILFLLSKTLTNSLFGLFHRITRSKKISIYLLSILFLPGTVVHEMAHAIMASLLHVHVGKMEFMPKLTGNNLKLGSVEVGVSDPFRRTLIGINPFLIGTISILGILFLGVRNQLFTNQLYVIISGYIVFEVSNTMFSSKKDLEGALGVTIAIITIVVILYFVGFRIPALNPNHLFSNSLIEQTFQKASLFMLAPLCIDLILLIIIKIFKSNS